MAQQTFTFSSSYTKQFPSKLKEPKVVIVWSSVHNINTLTIVESILKKKDIRTESLDVNKKSNQKYLSMFRGGPKEKYPKVFIYESNDADFICMASDIQDMIDDNEFDEEFEECVGSNQVEEEKFNETDFMSKSQKICESDDFKSKKMCRYSSEELAAYMIEKSFNDLTRNMIKYKVSGKDLKKIQNPKELMKLLHIEQEIAEDFFEIIQEEKEREIAKNLNQKFAETSENWLNKPMLKWTTRETKGWIASFIKDEKQRLIIFKAFDKHNFNGRTVLRYDNLDDLCQELEIDQDCEDIKIVEKIISAAGIQMDKEFDSDEKKEDKKNEKEKEFRVRDFRKKKYGYIRSSKLEDCIMKYTDDDGIPRASMECGHAIASNTMFYYIKQTFTSNYSASDIACPVPTCQRKWDWGICTMVADMNDDELTYYNKLRTKRIFTNLTECRNCGKMVDRPTNLTEMRVVCSCSNTNFCFQCGLPWKKWDSKIVCGNKECKIVQDLNETLKNQSWNQEKVWGQESRGLPKIRACPRCLTLVIHKRGCKWMTCKACKKAFCFCCLSIATDDGKLKCKNTDGKKADDHFGICPVAPIQQFG